MMGISLKKIEEELELALSAEGHVYLISESSEQNQITSWFAYPYPLGLLKLGLHEVNSLPPSFVFWRGFVRQLLTQVRKLPDLANTTVLPIISAPDKITLESIIQQAPFIRGFEYLNADQLTQLWQQLNNALGNEIIEFKGSVQDYFMYHNPKWNLLGRVCFHLAENKNNSERPFAFVATYTSQINQHSSAQHVPLKKALQEYAGEKNQAALLALLLPVQKAAEKSAFIQELVSSGHIFQALTWDVREAHRFLTDLPLIEDSGVMIRIPNWWNTKKPPRPKINVSVGEQPAAMLGLSTLLDFNIKMTLGDGQTLSSEEWRVLMNSQESLVKVKGQWVEVDRNKLESVLTHWERIKASAGDGISIADAMRLLAGAKRESDVVSVELIEEGTANWSNIIAGDWLKTVLTQLRDPRILAEKPIEKTLKIHLKATLRPYQLTGVNWLWLLYQLKLGACLADDMGLGKTIQMLAFLVLTKHHNTQSIRKPHLLVVPASLIGNWESEITRFSPSLSYRIVHGSLGEEDALLESSKAKLQATDLVITTYTFVHRLEWLKSVEWQVLILDEAQAIKNPVAKQTLAVKALHSVVRFALTGTPVENRLSDLWSLFDFTSPGLLGSASAFTRYEKRLLKQADDSKSNQLMVVIRTLTQPYILRRLKSDKAIISDLPDKTEIQTFCTLSKAQIQLYADAVHTLSRQLEELEGIQRRGVVLSYLMRFKQICNHPAQWLGYGDYAEQDSGKWQRLREICTEIAAKQEKVLVFTQFKEIIPPLSNFLAIIFGREGLSLHGDTPVKQRQFLVEAFQEEQGPPFFVLSLKAGGTGLTLTRASHVIHFDRWWNPAVENQATDRAYRIGQKHPVMVHKFICRGTIEEKIDEMIQNKKALSQEILQSGHELSLTELSNDALLDMISLDIHRALGEK